MAIDLTGKTQPAFGTDATADTACTQIRCNPGHKCKIIADGAIYVFNGVDDTDPVASAADRIALSAAEAAQGYETIIGEPLGVGINYGTVCVAAQASTVVLRASSEPGTGKLYR